MEIWELIVYCNNGHVYNILGDEDIFKAELIAWKHWQQDYAGELQTALSIGREYIDTAGLAVREVPGFTHDVQRLPATLGYQFESIQGMVIQKIP